MDEDGPSWGELRGTLEEGGASPDDLDRFDEWLSRRSLLSRAGKGGALALLTGMGTGADVALRKLFGRGLLPAAWGQEPGAPVVPEGPPPDMTIHNSRPLNGEFAPHLLDASVTPSRRHFVRNNGMPSDRALARDARGFELVVEGEVQRRLELDLQEIEAMPSVTRRLMIECGGNGRALYEPRVRGNPWERGAIGCAEWTGVPLRDLLTRAGLRDDALYTAHYGDDLPLGAAEPFSRGIPIEKAMTETPLVAYRMNGEPLPTHAGFPLRLVVPGWVGSCSQKWLNRIVVRDRVHDSQKMRGYSYRVPRHPVTPGSRPPKDAMVIATAFPVKSMITRPGPEARATVGAPLEVGGHAWVGEGAVEKVMVSIDYGVHWEPATLTAPANPGAWSDWRAAVRFPGPGYYEVWARAFDDRGGAQPFRQPWNPKGYLGNVIHRVPVSVDA